MRTRQVRCEASGCGTLNRVPRYGPNALPKCGKCGSELPEPVTTRILRWLVQHRGIYWLGGPAAAIALVVAAIPDDSGSSSVNECESRPQPRQGIYKWYGAIWGEDVTPFTVEAASGANYFVKLEDEFGRPVRAYFVKGGSIISYKVPVGTFNLKYATGHSWCSETDYFGADSSFYRAAETFTFDEQRGWTVRLIRQKGGNLRTLAITKDQF
jgi:hypothetical protein